MDINGNSKINLIGISGKLQSGKDLTANIIRYLIQQKRIGEVHTWENWIDWTYQDDLEYKGDWQIKKFAYKVKQILSLLTGITVEAFEKEEVKNGYLGKEWNRWRVDWYKYTPWHWADQRTTYHISLKECLERTGETIQDLEESNHEYSEERITVRQALQMIGTDLFRDKFHPNTWCNALFSEIDKDLNINMGKAKNFSTPILLGNPRSKQEEVEFKCSCGNVFISTQWRVETGHTKSCGCYQKYRVSKSSLKHGDSTTRLMSIYKNMKTRCYNENTDVYKKYGALGITVCDEWLQNYNDFKNWSIWNGYSEELSLDRIDNKGNYSPDNCRWIYIKDQAKNKEVYFNNKLGIRGVSFDKKIGKYVAQIQFEKKKIHIGYFNTPQEASEAYEHKRNKLFDIKSHKNTNNSKNFIITDVRFKEGCQAILDRGGILIRVNRYPKTIIIDNQLRAFDKGCERCLKEWNKEMHSSETALDNYDKFKYIIYNSGTIEELIEKVKEILIKENMLT